MWYHRGMSINVLGSPSEFRGEAKRLLDREKSKRKIANYFLSGEDVGCVSVPDADMTEEQLQEVGEKLTSGEISEESRKKLLRHVQGPMVLFGEKNVFNGNADRGCEGIEGHDREKKILGKVMKVKPADLTPLDLAHFDKAYPTPLDFERKAAEFMDAVGKTASPEEFAEYEKAMESFQRKVYGEKYEYYLAMRALISEAEERASMPSFAGDVVRRRASIEEIEGEDVESHPRVRPTEEGAAESDGLDAGWTPRTRPIGGGSDAIRVRPVSDDERPDAGSASRLRPFGESADAIPFDSGSRVSVEDLRRIPTVWGRRPEGSGSGTPRRRPSDDAPTMIFPVEEPARRGRGVDDSITPRLVMPYEYASPRDDEVIATDTMHETEGDAGGAKRRYRRAERLNIERQKGKPLAPEYGREVVERVKLEGDELLVLSDGRIEPYTLTHEDMLRAELDPSYEVEVDGVWVGLSDVFLVDGGREAAVGYVEGSDGEIHARSYYRSGRDAVWRYLPDRMQDSETGQVIWYGKGRGDESLTLPAELQAVLNRRMQASNLKSELEMTDDEERVNQLRQRAFYGIAKSVEDPKLRAIGSVDDALSREVDDSPAFSFLDGVSPEMLMPVRDPFWPDFAKELVTSESESGIYGHITLHTYESENGELRWTIIEDDRGHAWVGHVETKAPITSTGLRSQWVKAGGLERSLYELPLKAIGYGDITDAVYGIDESTGEKYVRYVSMWKEYLSKLAIIQAYKGRVAK